MPTKAPTSDTHTPGTHTPADSNSTALLWIMGAFLGALLIASAYYAYGVDTRLDNQRDAYLAGADPIEAALNDKYIEPIGYTRHHGQQYPTSRFKSLYDTITIDGTERTDCTLTLDHTPDGDIADATLDCDIKPVREARAE